MFVLQKKSAFQFTSFLTIFFYFLFVYCSLS